MPSGDFATRLTIWLALAGYAIGTALLLRGAAARARVVWTFGCACYVAHVFCAFAFFHHWSHGAAYEETARQTLALVGWNSGSGLLVNYVFTAVWLADVLWWWLAPASHVYVVPPSGGPAVEQTALAKSVSDRLEAERRVPRRARLALALVHGFFFFMVINGAVVFGHGPVRVYGAVICLVVMTAWRRAKRVEAPRGS